MTKRKLVYILHDIKVGGAEVALISAIPQLASKYDLVIVVLGKIEEALLRDLSDDERRLFISFDYPILSYPITIRKPVKYIQNLSPDLIVCSFWRASIVGILVKKILPQVQLYSFNHSTRFPHFFSSFFTKRIGKMADKILTDSVATSQFVRQVIDPKCPITEISFLTHSTPTISKVVAPQPNKPINFMFLGRINKVKNLPLMIRVINDLVAKGHDIVFDVYGRNDGDMSESEKLLKEFGLENRVSFKGEINVNERFSLFSRYQFYLQLSSYEGMAMSVAEAMQNGLVCIVTPVGEIVNYSKDMHSAVYFNIVDKAEWSTSIAKIESVIENSILYDRISSNCHSHFLSVKTYSESLIDELENL